MKSFIGVAVLLGSLCVWAQQPPSEPQAPPAPQQQPSQPQPITAQQPQPMSPEPQQPQVAPAEIPAAEGPAEAITPGALGADYGGPAILSRGGTARVTRGGDLLGILPFASVSGIYDSGLATVSLDRSGNWRPRNGWGVETEFGANGVHNWKTSSLGLDYRGAFRHYSPQTYFDGMDNSLNLSYQKQVTPHFSFSIGENAARYQRSFFLPMAVSQFYDPTYWGLTQNELFDSTTSVYMTSGQMVYQSTARLSFGAEGSNFIVRRRSQSLFGVNGYVARGDVAYRLSRFQTIGFEYEFSRYDFTRAFGTTDIHGVAVNYSARLSRNWEAALRLGGYRAESARIQAVRVDPVIAAILRTSVLLAKMHDVAYIPHYDVRLTRGFRRGSFQIGYGRAVLPGNGVYGTSGSESAHIGGNYRESRTVSISGEVGYSTYSNLTGQRLGKYRSYDGRLGASYRLMKNVSLTLEGDARRYDIGGANLSRNYYRASLGLAWSPGEYPFSLW